MERTNEDSLDAYTGLLEWMTQHGGHLHESVQIAKDERRGVHIQVKKDCGNLPKKTCIINTPLAVTMSYFNAIDHRLPSEADGGESVFSAHSVALPPAFIDAVGHEETTIFFLMGQYLQGSVGFWFPWIRTLPQPGHLTTPLYYEGDDLEWLEGTSLLPAREQKMKLMKDKYESGFNKLRESGFGDAERYTWDLYLWASAIIVSRAFSAKVLSGVIPDEELPEENVSVLLPFIDILNHRPLAKVEWRAGKGNVGFLVLEDIPAGQEVSNNYGPRNNEQLMMNYGFCLPDNPCDYRILSLRAPPGSPLHEAKAQQLKMYPALPRDGDDHYYVFNIFYPLLAPGSSMEHSIFSPALLNALSILAANERELETLEIAEHEIRIPGLYGNSRNLLAALSQITIELITHIVRLKSSSPGPQQPESLKQTYGKVYRDSQVTLSETALLIAAWTLMRARQHNLSGHWEETKYLLSSHMARVPVGKFAEEIVSRVRVRILERESLLANSGELFAFNELFGLLAPEMQESCKTCSSQIFAQAEKTIPMLRGSSESSPFAFPIFLCLTVAIHRAANATTEKRLPARLTKWASFIIEKYPPPPDDVAWMLEDEDDEHIASLFDDVLETMRTQKSTVLSSVGEFTGDHGDSWWLSPNWLRWAWMIMERETVQVPDDPLKTLTMEAQGQVMLSTESYLYIPAER